MKELKIAEAKNNNKKLSEDDIKKIEQSVENENNLQSQNQSSDTKSNNVKSDQGNNKGKNDNGNKGNKKGKSKK